MQLVRIDSIFEVKYGSNLELNTLDQDDNGINFVSRSAANNGVSAIVKKLDYLEPIAPNVLTVAGGGSVLETFLQTEPFYSGRDLYYLRPKIKLSNAELLYYSVCIKSNRYKYSYGRQANKTLKSLLIPNVSHIPAWVNDSYLTQFRLLAKQLQVLE